MFELVKLFPRRPLAVTIASWMFFFILPLIHRRTACRRPAEETKGCASESRIMVLKQKTGPRKGAPDRCYHVTTPTASKSPSTTTAWWPVPSFVRATPYASPPPP